MCFEKRKKMSKTIEYSLERTMDFFPFGSPIGVYHFYDRSFSERSYKNIEYK